MMQPTQGTFLGITPVSSVSNGLYFLTLPVVSVMRVIYTSKGMSKKFGVRVILPCKKHNKSTERNMANVMKQKIFRSCNLSLGWQHTVSYHSLCLTELSTAYHLSHSTVTRNVTSCM